MQGKLGVFVIGLSGAVRFPPTDKQMITISIQLWTVENYYYYTRYNYCI